MASNANKTTKPAPEPAPVGAPRQLEGGRAVNVYLDAASITKAERLGDGVISKGIRIALQAAKITTKGKQ